MQTADANKPNIESLADDRAVLAAVDLITQVDWDIAAVAEALQRSVEWVQAALDNYVAGDVVH